MFFFNFFVKKINKQMKTDNYMLWQTLFLSYIELVSK